MTQSARFIIKPLAQKGSVIYVLQVRKSCEASIAQSWLARRGVHTTFKLCGWWYEASWGNSPEAEAIAPLLQNEPWLAEEATMHGVDYALVAGLAEQYGAVECCWRESDRSFTGFVAEVWFDELPSEFATNWAAVIGYAVKVRQRPDGIAKFAVSVPCLVCAE
jgi:hypothetical protein